MSSSPLVEFKSRAPSFPLSLPLHFSIGEKARKSQDFVLVNLFPHPAKLIHPLFIIIVVVIHILSVIPYRSAECKAESIWTDSQTFFSRKIHTNRDSFLPSSTTIATLSSSKATTAKASHIWDRRGCLSHLLSLAFVPLVLPTTTTHQHIIIIIFVINRRSKDVYHGYRSSDGPSKWFTD